MSTDLDPTQLAIEFLRRDKTELSGDAANLLI